MWFIYANWPVSELTFAFPTWIGGKAYPFHVLLFEHFLFGPFHLDENVSATGGKTAAFQRGAFIVFRIFRRLLKFQPQILVLFPDSCETPRDSTSTCGSAYTRETCSAESWDSESGNSTSGATTLP